MEPQISSIFPCPVYVVKRDSNLDSTEEEKEIGNIVKEGMYKNAGNSTSNNTDIFNGKLKNIKQFCEQQLKIYVERVIAPKNELDFYITQSWLNITQPGEYHLDHSHQNSITSGVFYIQTDVGQTISYCDPNRKIKNLIIINPQEITNFWSAGTMSSDVKKNMLLLFPSWLEHSVEPNEKQTKDVISISFNTFVRGNLGDQKKLSQLILQ